MLIKRGALKIHMGNVHVVAAARLPLRYEAGAAPLRAEFRGGVPIDINDTGRVQGAREA